MRTTPYIRNNIIGSATLSILNVLCLLFKKYIKTISLWISQILLKFHICKILPAKKRQKKTQPKNTMIRGTPPPAKKATKNTTPKQKIYL